MSGTKTASGLMVAGVLISTCKMNEIARLVRFDRCLAHGTKPEQFLHDVCKPKGFCALIPYGYWKLRIQRPVPLDAYRRLNFPASPGYTTLFYFGGERMRNWRREVRSFWRGQIVFNAARSTLVLW